MAKGLYFAAFDRGVRDIDFKKKVIGSGRFGNALPLPNDTPFGVVRGPENPEQRVDI